MAVAYGSHSLCNDKIDFLHSEIVDFVKKGFWMIFPYETVEEHPDLHI